MGRSGGAAATNAGHGQTVRREEFARSRGQRAGRGKISKMARWFLARAHSRRCRAAEICARFVQCGRGTCSGRATVDGKVWRQPAVLGGRIVLAAARVDPAILSRPGGQVRILSRSRAGELCDPHSGTIRSVQAVRGATPPYKTAWQGTRSGGVSGPTVRRLVTKRRPVGVASGTGGT